MKWPTHRTVAALLAAIVALLVISGCTRSTASGGSGVGSSDPHVLVFAAVPSDRLATLRQAYQPILELLKKETGMEVQFQSGTNYAAIIEGLRNGKIDVAALGPFSYALAMQRGAPITVVASRDEKGEAPGYRAYGITWVGSPIKSLANFRGKRICFVDRDSTSGYLYPSAGLLAMGIDPDKDTIPIFVGRHDASAIAVANHQCDAGFALDRVVDPRLIEQQGQLQPDQIITVWKSEAIPSPPIVIANHLPPKLRQQLTTALQHKANADYLRANGFCQGKCTIADGGASGYKPANDADYNGIREICRRIQNKSCTEG